MVNMVDLTLSDPVNEMFSRPILRRIWLSRLLAFVELPVQLSLRSMASSVTLSVWFLSHVRECANLPMLADACGVDEVFCLALNSSSTLFACTEEGSGNSHVCAPNTSAELECRLRECCCWPRKEIIGEPSVRSARQVFKCPRLLPYEATSTALRGPP